MYHYLKEYQTENHRSIYTPAQRKLEEAKQPLGITFSPKAYEPRQWNTESTTVGYQNNKKYFDSVK